MQPFERTAMIRRVNGRGVLSASAQQALDRHLDARVRHLEDGQETPGRVKVTGTTRSTAANNLYRGPWMEKVLVAFAKAGKAFTDEDIHIYLKPRVLPRLAQEWLEMTGEEVDYEDWHSFPDGSSHRTLTTTRLTPGQFSMWLMMGTAHLQVDLGLDVDVSDVLDEAGTPEAPKLKSGRIDEAGRSRYFRYPEEETAPLSDEPFASPPAPGDEPAPGPLHEARPEAPQDRPSARPVTMADLYAANPHDAVEGLF